MQHVATEAVRQLRKGGGGSVGASARSSACGEQRSVDARTTGVGVPCGSRGAMRTRARTASSGDAGLYARAEACGAVSVKRRAAPDGSRHAGLWGDVARRNGEKEGREGRERIPPDLLSFPHSLFLSSTCFVLGRFGAALSAGAKRVPLASWLAGADGCLHPLCLSLALKGARQ